MIPRFFLAFASALSLFSPVSHAQTITVTTHVSACKATYTSGQLTTVVQSTVTVLPTPWTDTAANAGTPFVIRLEQVDVSGYPDQQGAAPYWLMDNGNTTTNSSLAAVYYIKDGQLLTLNGSHASTNYNVVDQAFAVTDYLMPINTTFSVHNRMLNWTNPAFTNGTAQFYKLPPGLLDNAQILVKFLGPMEGERSWSPVILWVEPVNTTSLVSTSASSGGLSTPVVSSGSVIASGSLAPSIASNSMASGIASGSMASSIPGVSMPSSIPGVSMASSIPGVSMASSIPSASGLLSSSVSSGMLTSLLGASMPSGETMTSMAPSSSISEASSVPKTAQPSDGQPILSLLSSVASSVSSSASSVLSALSPSASAPLSSATSSSISSTSSPTPSSTAPAYLVTSDGVEFSVEPDATYSGTFLDLDTILAKRDGYTLNDCLVTCAHDTSCVGTAYNTSTSSCFFYSSITSGSKHISNGTEFATVVHRGSNSTTVTGSISTLNDVSESSRIFSTTAIPTSLAPSSSNTFSSASSFTSISSQTLSPSSKSSSTGSASISGIGPVVVPSSSSLVSSTVAVVSSVSSTTRVSSSTASPVPSSTTSLVSSSTASSASLSTISHVSSSTTSLVSSSVSSSVISQVSSSATSPIVSQVSSSATSHVSSSTTSSSGSPAVPTFVCPRDNAQTLPDALGILYTIGCGNDTTGGGIPHSASNGFNDCFSICDASAGCNSFTYTGGPNGVGGGTCYIKDGFSNPVFQAGGGSGYVAAIQPVRQVVSSSVAGQASPVNSNNVAATATSSSPAASGDGAAVSPSATATFSGKIASPTACDFGDPPHSDEDDSYCEIDLPFDMTFYGQTTRVTYASVNGYLSILTGSSQFDSSPPLPNSKIPTYTLLPFFDDMFIYGEIASQGIYYEIDGTTVTIEWYVNRFSNNEFYDFTLTYDSTNPGVFVYKYYVVGTGDNGGTATVGTQGQDSNGNPVAATYSHYTKSITPGLTVTCDTNANTCKSS